MFIRKRTSSEASVKYSSDAVLKLALETPQQTTQVAHKFTDRELKLQLNSPEKISRLFGHICRFARAEFDSADKFSLEFLELMQQPPLTPDQSFLCEYFLTQAKHYLPNELKNSNEIEAAFLTFKEGIKRHKAFFAHKPESSLQSLHDATYAWLEVIESSKALAHQDAETLLSIITLYEKEEKGHPMIDAMIGHIIGHYENQIPAATIAKFNNIVQKLRKSDDYLYQCLDLLFSHKTCLSTGNHILYSHSRFQLNQAIHRPIVYIELPNTMVEGIANIIAADQTPLMNYYHRANGMRYNNLTDIFATMPKIKDKFESSTHPETVTLLAMIQLSRQRSVDREGLETALNNCSQRLHKIVVSEYVGTYVINDKYDPELHVILTNAMLPYLDDPEMKYRQKRMQLLYQQPTYIDEVRTQLSEGLTRVSTTVSTTFMEYARPAAQYVATYSSNLFSAVTEARNNDQRTDSIESIKLN